MGSPLDALMCDSSSDGPDRRGDLVDLGLLLTVGKAVGQGEHKYSKNTPRRFWTGRAK